MENEAVGEKEMGGYGVVVWRQGWLGEAMVDSFLAGIGQYPACIPSRRVD
jgi:hypothetical protein